MHKNNYVHMQFIYTSGSEHHLDNNKKLIIIETKVKQVTKHPPQKAKIEF